MIVRLILCFSVVQVSTAFMVCQEGQLLKEFSDGKYTCMICPKCPPGQGATVQCGSAVPNNVSVTCKACEPEEYSDSFSSESCKHCSSCLPGEAIVAECHNISDTRCNWKLCDSVDVLQFFSLASLKELDNLSLTTGLIVIILISCFTYMSVIQRKNKLNNYGQSSPFPSLKGTEHVVTAHQYTKPGTTEDTSKDTCKVESEFPAEQKPGHVLFEKTGVEVIAKSTDQPLPSQLALQAASHSTKPGFLEEEEIQLSHVIKFIASSTTEKLLEVKIPHGANMILSSAKWQFMVKELVNNVWVTVRQSGKGIQNLVPKSNYITFETNHLSTFVVTGKLENFSLQAFKRMKVAAFCSETSIGEDLILRLYCFDDCEYSFEKLMKKEQQKGGKLISSIDSLDFDVNSDRDVEISTTDNKGWQLDQASPMKLSSNLLRNSFDIIPQCNLVFHPTTAPDKNKSSFFVVLTLTQDPCTQTVVYASTVIKKTLCSQGYRNELYRKNESRTHVGSPMEAKQMFDSDGKCIIQM